MLFCPYRTNLKNISVTKFTFIKVEGLHLSNLHEMDICTGIFQLFLRNVQKTWFVEIQSLCLFFIFIETALVQIAYGSPEVPCIAASYFLSPLYYFTVAALFFFLSLFFFAALYFLRRLSGNEKIKRQQKTKAVRKK